MPLSKRKVELYHACIVLIAILLFIRFCLIFSFSINLDGAEFAFVHNTQLLHQHISIYRNPDAFPFYAIMYTPLYYYILVTLAHFLGANPIYEAHRVFIIGRGVNFFMMFFCLWMLYRIMMRFNLAKNAAWLLLLLFTMLITGHFYTARPDGFKLTLFIGQIYCILHYFYLDIKKKKYVYLIVVFNLISFLLKQDAFVYSNLLLFVLMRSKKNRQTKMLFLGCVLLAVISYLFCASGFGKYFYVNTFIYNFQTITDFKHSYNIKIIFLSIFRLSALIFICGYLSRKYKEKINKDSIEHLLTASAIPAFIAAHIFMLKSGAYINYSFELIVLLILLTAKLLSVYLSANTINGKTRDLVFIYFIVFIFINNFILYNDYKHATNEPYEAAYIEHYETSLELRPVLKDDVFFLPNANNLIYFSDYKNLFYGYDAHIDRFINLSLGLDVKSKLMLASPKNVDDCLKNGFVKYIVIEDTDKSKKHMAKYYPDYSYYLEVRKFSVYKYDTALLK